MPSGRRYLPIRNQRRGAHRDTNESIFDVAPPESNRQEDRCRRRDIPSKSSPPARGITATIVIGCLFPSLETDLPAQAKAMRMGSKRRWQPALQASQAWPMSTAIAQFSPA
jgi:hypothetical protein